MTLNDLKKEWYENRLKWSISRHKSLSSEENLYENFSNEIKDFISSKQFFGKPLYMLWKDKSCWTLITNYEIISNNKYGYYYCSLDDINKNVTFYRKGDYEPDNIKKEIEFLTVGNKQNIVWAPAGGSLFGFFNVLLRFPISTRLLQTNPERLVR